MPEPEDDSIITVPKEKTDKGIQINIKTKIRSQGTSTKWPVVNRANSPIPPNTCDASVSPIKQLQPFHIPAPENIYSGEDTDTDMSSCSDSKTKIKSCSDYEQNNSEVEEIQVFDLKSSMQRDFTLLIEEDPHLFLGLPEECYFLLRYLEKTVHVRTLNLMITFKKIRLNDQYAILAKHFGLSKSSICRIFNETVQFIAPIMKKFVWWPAPQIIKRNLPVAFRSRYSEVQAIIDCFETKMEQPTHPVYQSLSWSEYKKANTLKYLVSCTPDGFINYISQGYGGRSSDSNLTDECGFLDMLKPGMYVMADRGFKNIAHSIEKKSCVLVRPPSVSSKTQSSANEVRESKKIASLRIHV